jgi:ADP-ribose pyrophosphatase
MSESPEPTISSERIYRGRIVSLRVDEVRLASGQTRKREIVEHGGAVAIVAIDDQERVLLVRQFRKPVERSLLEIPAGTLEEGEDPDSCARRELLEETGHTAERVERLFGFYSAPGFCTEYLHLYLATGLSQGAASPEEDESIELVREPVSRALELIESGQIEDAKSQVGLLAYLAHRLQQPGPSLRPIDRR